MLIPEKQEAHGPSRQRISRIDSILRLLLASFTEIPLESVVVLALEVF